MIFLCIVGIMDFKTLNPLIILSTMRCTSEAQRVPLESVVPYSNSMLPFSHFVVLGQRLGERCGLDQFMCEL